MIVYVGVLCSLNRAPDGSWMRAAGSLSASETGHYEAQKELRPR